ncbi:peptide ABC transporter substrate-binding protein [Roseospirillum parvum]|uniref:Peptide/nickel transport system substrate-binding protein n=1 Tax=Roseospirillum parvum TaxID=83401 RepID=A0A1G7V854_9PROT|nr:peptide ABC transporter substrate-binding protein [Roseospirillum parvum]SDG55897.1 peptide/nickel transport system substrate-binding protein [Roseospirillum parvum]
MINRVWTAFRRAAGLVAVGVCLWALVAGGPARAVEPVEGPTLTIGITQFPGNFHPAIDAMMAKKYILSLTRRPLTAYDADWHLVCLLCEELPTLENGGARLEDIPPEESGLGDGKGMAVTYTLKAGARWGDGIPVSTRDVVFAWQVGRHPDSGITNGELYRRIRAVEVHDGRTFTLHLDRVSFKYNALNDFKVLPAHIERVRFEADPARYRTLSAYERTTEAPGLYFGPYRVERVTPGVSVSLVRNETWWGKPPVFGRIVVKAIENTSALEANLLSGSIDMIAGELGLTIDQALALERRHGDRFQFLYRPGLVYEHLDARLDDPILRDVRVRQALMYGLDRELITGQLFEGRQPVAHGPVSPLDPMYAAEGVPHYQYDPARAKVLLEDAGWHADPSGVRRNADGEPLRLTLATTAGNRIRELVQQVLQSQWRTIGVEVRIDNQPPRVLFGQGLSRRTFQGLALFAWISSPDNVPRTTLHSAMIPSADNGWAGQNYTGFANPEMDRLIDALEVELDPAARAALWRDLQALYAERLPALPLYFRANTHVLPRWLEGVRPTGHQDPTTLWVEDWRIGPGGPLDGSGGGLLDGSGGDP